MTLNNFFEIQNNMRTITAGESMIELLVNSVLHSIGFIMEFEEECEEEEDFKSLERFLDRYLIDMKGDLVKIKGFLSEMQNASDTIKKTMFKQSMEDLGKF